MAIGTRYNNISSAKSSATSKTLSYTTAPSQGDYVVVIVALQANLSNITCSNDNAGNTFTLLQHANLNGASIAMFGGKINILPSSPYGMTITYGGSATAQVWEIVYLTGNGVTYAGQGNAIGESASTYSFASATAVGTFILQAGDSNKAGYGTITTSGASTLDSLSTSGSGASSNIGLVVGTVSISPGVSYTISYSNLASNYNGLCYAEFEEAGAMDTTPPANVTNLSGSHTYNSVTLTWTNPTDSDFDHTNVYRNGTILSNNLGYTSYTDSGLNGSTAYTYKVTSVDNVGNESTGTSIVVTTDPTPDTTPPANVTNLAQTHTYNSATLTWTNPTDSDFNHCNIYRGGTSVGTSTNGSFSDSGLSASTSYTYKVTSVDNSGNESTGSTINVTTSYAPDTTPPATPTGLVANVGNSQVSLSWNANGESDLAGYNIYRSTDNASFSKVANTTSTSYTDTGLTNGTKYYYEISAYDTSNNESSKTSSVNATPSVPSDTTPPANVSNLQGTHTSSTISLTWTNPSDSDFNHANIYRNNAKIGQSTNGSYNDSGLSSSTQYAYKVTSVDNVGNESTGISINITTDASAVSGGTIAQNGLIAYFNSKQGVSGNTWSNLAPTGTKYDATLVGSPVVGSGGMTFSSTTKNYAYLSNFTELGSGSATIEFRTNLDNATTEPDFYDTATSTNATSFTYGAYPSSDGTTIYIPTNDVGYNFPNVITQGVDNYISIVLDTVAKTLSVYRDGSLVQTTGGVVASSILPVPVTNPYFYITDQSYTVDGVLDNFRVYNRALSASEISGNYAVGSNVGLVSDTTPPAVPTGLTASGGNNQVLLNWNANSDSDFASYILYKSTDGSSFSKYFTGLTNTSITDNNVTNGTTYWYKLTAVDTTGNESAQSPSVNATPSAPVSYTPIVTSLTENKTKISPISGNNMAVVSIVFDHDINGYSININGTDHSSGTIIESGNAQTVAQISGSTVSQLSGNTVNQLRVTPSGTALIIDITNTELTGGQGDYRVNLYGKSKQDGTWTPYNN